MTITIHWEALASETRRVFDALATLPIPSDFYLAGGTALALQLGHRISSDLDFFSPDNLLGTAERAALAYRIQAITPCTIKREYDEQLYANLIGVEVSFIYQHHPLLFPTLEVSGLRLAQPADIGLMKLSAIKDRGTRRDFVDLYCLREIAPLKKLLQLLPQKFYDRPDFTVHLAYALRYFDDAENDPRELHLLKRVRWDAVKKYCIEGSNLLSKLNAGLEPPK
jgi:predicted nucleotidyltransferase component of viral defense system